MKSSMRHMKIKLPAADSLKRLARKRNVSVNDLIRKAISTTYQLDFLDLPEKQVLALSAYRGGYISLGKLAEEMGMTGLELRHWLNDHEETQTTETSNNDMDFA